MAMTSQLIIFLEPGDHDRGVETAGIEQNDFFHCYLFLFIGTACQYALLCDQCLLKYPTALSISSFFTVSGGMNRIVWCSALMSRSPSSLHLVTIGAGSAASPDADEQPLAPYLFDDRDISASARSSFSREVGAFFPSPS